MRDAGWYRRIASAGDMNVIAGGTLRITSLWAGRSMCSAISS
jgi:hypothetical protein